MTEYKHTVISRDEAQQALFFFNEGGMRPPGFSEALLCAINIADSENFKKLSEVFPGLCTAWRLGCEIEEGLELLRGIVRGEIDVLEVRGTHS